MPASPPRAGVKGQARRLPEFAGRARHARQARRYPVAPGLTLPEDAMDDGYDLLAVRIRRGTTIDGAIVALCPNEEGVVTADVCIDGPPVP